jgi:hypothetical protein
MSIKYRHNVTRVRHSSRTDQQYALVVPLLYSINWLLHVSAVVCHHQWSFLDPSELLESQMEWVVYHIMCGYVACVLDCCGSVYKRNYDNPAHRLHNHTLYDIQPIPFVIQVTQMDLRSSLMMADYCQNMQKPVYRIREWYNQCILLVSSTRSNMHGTNIKLWVRYI